MALSADASAASAVSALYFLATLCAPVNYALTGKGFKLYIPLGISTTFRVVAYAARAAVFVHRNADLMAVHGALNAAGFGIAIAMCCCFIVIWLRSAAHSHSPLATSAMSLLGRLLVVVVIVCGPVLGVTGAILVNATPSSPAVTAHGAQVRLASAAGLMAVTSAASLVSGSLALTWLLSTCWGAHQQPTNTSNAAPQTDKQDDWQQQQQQQGPAGVRPHDGLVVLLAACCLLMAWSAASRLASFTYPVINTSTVLHYTLTTLPELLVASVFAVPTLAARIALGGRCGVWRQHQQQQQQQQQGNHHNRRAQASNKDAEVGVVPRAEQSGQ